VTLKMRLGWDDGSRNAASWRGRAMRRRAARYGARRTRCQFYKGRADWRRCARQGERIGPVVVNGDIESFEMPMRRLRPLMRMP